MNNGNIMLMVFGTVAIAVAFIIFPIIITGAETVRLAPNVGEYTGLTSLVQIGPTLAFVTLILGGLVTTGAGAYGMYKSARGGGRSRSRR